MTTVKNKLLAQIEKKAQKIRDKRIEASNNKSIESAVFDFFKNIEESRKMHNGSKYDPYLFDSAKKSLAERISGFAPGTKISVEFNALDDLSKWEEQLVRGVTIWWSKTYILRNNVDQSMYIDVSQMLFN